MKARIEDGRWRMMGISAGEAVFTILYPPSSILALNPKVPS
jgi:hypothetical protein